MPELGPVGDQVQLGDLAVFHREPHHAQRLVPGAEQRPWRAVDGGGDRMGQEPWCGPKDMLGDRLRAGELERRRRASPRLASWRADSRVRPMIWPMSPDGTAKMSCSTNASRSGGVRLSSTTSSARPTASAITAWPASPSGSVIAHCLAAAHTSRI
jgi:hypothetical protein